MRLRTPPTAHLPDDRAAHQAMVDTADSQFDGWGSTFEQPIPQQNNQPSQLSWSITDIAIALILIGFLASLVAGAPW